jgi:hypothetical protein
LHLVANHPWLYALLSGARRIACPKECPPLTGLSSKPLTLKGPRPWHKTMLAWSWKTWSCIRGRRKARQRAILSLTKKREAEKVEKRTTPVLEGP